MLGKKSVWERLIDRTHCLKFTYTSVKSGMQLNSDWLKQKSMKILAELRRNLPTYNYDFDGIKYKFLFDHIGIKSHSDSRNVTKFPFPFRQNMIRNVISFRMEFHSNKIGMGMSVHSDKINLGM